jgi:ribosomal protein S12 methylthiotransferase accessory factor YcaO
VLQRVARAAGTGLDVPLPADDGLGARLLATVAQHPDAEAALRDAVLEYMERVRQAER